MKFIVFDIETQGLREEALALAEPFKDYEPLPPFDPKSVKIGNLKDADKIAAKIRAEEEAYPQKQKEHKETYNKAKFEYETKIVSKAALNALCARVIAIGVKDEKSETIISGEEASILKSFWELYGTRTETFIGWNINTFDIPFLVRRSWACGVIVPNIFNGRFLNSKFLDLMEKFACGEYGYKLSLDKAAQFLGVPGKYKGDCAGDTFADKYLSADPVFKAEAEEYLKCDLRATWNVAERLFATEKKEDLENEFC